MTSSQASIVVFSIINNDSTTPKAEFFRQMFDDRSQQIANDFKNQFKSNFNNIAQIRGSIDWSQYIEEDDNKKLFLNKDFYKLNTIDIYMEGLMTKYKNDPNTITNEENSILILLHMKFNLNNIKHGAGSIDWSYYFKFENNNIVAKQTYLDKFITAPIKIKDSIVELFGLIDIYKLQINGNIRDKNKLFSLDLFGNELTDEDVKFGVQEVGLELLELLKKTGLSLAKVVKQENSNYAKNSLAIIEYLDFIQIKNKNYNHTIIRLSSIPVEYAIGNKVLAFANTVQVAKKIYSILPTSFNKTAAIVAKTLIGNTVVNYGICNDLVAQLRDTAVMITVFSAVFYAIPASAIVIGSMQLHLIRMTKVYAKYAKNNNLKITLSDFIKFVKDNPKTLEVNNVIKNSQINLISFSTMATIGSIQHSNDELIFKNRHYTQ